MKRVRFSRLWLAWALLAPLHWAEAGLAQSAVPRLLAREGPADMVTQEVWSPKGSLVAEACLNGNVALRDPSTGAVVRNLQSADDGVESVAFSPDGKRLIAGSHLWDCSTGKLLLNLPLNDGGIYGVAYTLDGRSLLTYSNIQYVDHPAPGQAGLQLWDAGTGRFIESIALPPGYSVPDSPFWNPRVMALSPDGKTLAVRLLGKVLKLPPGDGKLNLEEDQNAVALYDTRDYHVANLIVIPRVGSSLSCFCWSPNSRSIACGYDSQDANQGIEVFDVDSGHQIASVGPDQNESSTDFECAWTPRGSRLVTVGPREIELRDIHSGEILRKIPIRNPSSGALSPDGSHIMVGGGEPEDNVGQSNGGFCTFCNLNTGQVEYTLAAPLSQQLLTVGPKGFLELATDDPRKPDENSVLDFFDWKSGRHRNSYYVGSENSVGEFVPGPDSRYLASLEGNVLEPYLYFRDPRTLWPIRHVLTRGVCVAFAPKFGLCLTGENDWQGRNFPLSYIQVRNQFGKPLRRLELPGFGQPSIPFQIGRIWVSPDQTLVVATSRSDRYGFSGCGGIAMWNLSSGKRLWNWTGGGGWQTPFTIAFTSDSRQVISLHLENDQIQMRNALTGHLEPIPAGLEQNCVALAVRPGASSGKTTRDPEIATSDDHGIIRLWGLNSGHVFARFHQDDPVEVMAYAPDGSLLLTLGLQGEVQTYGMRDHSLRAKIEILSFTYDKSGRPSPVWLARTPDGYYTGSPGIERWINWQVGGQILPGGALAARFRRPDVVAAAFNGR